MIKPQTKNELLDKAINTVLNPSNDYHVLIKEAVTEHLGEWDYEELYDLVYEGNDEQPQ